MKSILFLNHLYCSHCRKVSVFEELFVSNEKGIFWLGHLLRILSLKKLQHFSFISISWGLKRFFFLYRTLRWQNLKASCKCADFYIRVSSNYKPSRNATGKLVRSELTSTSENFRFVDEIFSILSSARTRASVTLAGKHDSRRHSTTSFSEKS